MRFAIVAGEVSGDTLAAELIQALKTLYPNATFEGVAGPKMIAAGCKPLASIEALSLMGIVEVLGALPRLFKLRRTLVNHFLENPPDVFIGVDAPDFNLSLEKALKRRGIKTVHYCSPTVWAWRQGRIKTIKKSTDLMLTLFPFEASFYEQHHMPVQYVGHPLGDMIPFEPPRAQARQQFGLNDTQPVIALLPGSRGSEIKYLAKDFLETAKWCLQFKPELQFVLPAANDRRYGELKALLDPYGSDFPVQLLRGQAREALASADAVLCASGTAALEACLMKKPMVVAYRMSPVTFFLMRFLFKGDHYALPNLLAGKRVVPEITQHQVTPETLGQALLDWFDHSGRADEVRKLFSEIHQRLAVNGAENAARAIRDFLNSHLV